MRVISGTAKGRKLKTPKGYEVRPTSEMIKESIFSAIQFEISGKRVLDLFAGTGQMGIEALSRGASEAVFIDSSKSSALLVKENIEACKFNARVINTDAISYLKQAEKFDIIFIDPPYDTDLAEKSLEIIQNIDLLCDGGIIICETYKEKDLVLVRDDYEFMSVKIHGRIKITRIVRNTK
ncbi:MAG: 16S rRNA (guanine(966)-N(2))-methyltransferase RsmD [Ruminococcaceae bacterium]|nr:16S rRNA (guanine(966)-N(2))-methyltransferase RsmD [Oscillospiraceae bacterium]